MKSFRLRVETGLRRLRSFYDRAIMTPAFFSFGMFLLASFLACVIVVTGNPYMGANYIDAVIVSGPIYLCGVALALWHLLRFSGLSAPAWIAFIVNMIPFGFTAYAWGALLYERMGR